MIDQFVRKKVFFPDVFVRKREVPFPKHFILDNRLSTRVFYITIEYPQKHIFFVDQIRKDNNSKYTCLYVFEHAIDTTADNTQDNENEYIF